MDTKKDRRRPRIRQGHRPGAIPGTIEVHPDSRKPTIQSIGYDGDSFTENTLSLNELKSEFASIDDGKTYWVNVDGLGDARALNEIRDSFGLHVLALEDVLNVQQQAKVDRYEDHLFIVARSASFAEGFLQTEQISLFVGDNFVLTLQERPGDCFEQIRRRLREKNGRIRDRKADYLCYAFLDAIVDSYFPVVDQYAERLDELESQVLENASPEILSEIHAVRTELLSLRRRIRPHREAVRSLINGDDSIVSEETRLFFGDCYDHVHELIELTEMYRDMCSGIQEHHLSLVSTKMNEVMKVLTVISTIFIPLSFFTGLWGMNFNTTVRGNMPELNLPFGYPIALGLMAILALAMITYFRRNGWL